MEKVGVCPGGAIASFHLAACADFPCFDFAKSFVNPARKTVQFAPPFLCRWKPLPSSGSQRFVSKRRSEKSEKSEKSGKVNLYSQTSQFPSLSISFYQIRHVSACFGRDGGMGSDSAQVRCLRLELNFALCI